MLALLLTLSLAQVPPPQAAALPTIAPTAIETARLYFIAGELRGSREWCERGLKRESKACKPFLRTLAEYQFLIAKFDELTLAEARQVIELDRVLSPKEPARLTKPIIERFVTGPMNRAKAWASQGAAGEAVKFVDDALTVDPKNAEAKGLRAQLVSLADAGLSLALPDAGR
jgi:hypothetical protein